MLRRLFALLALLAAVPGTRPAQGQTAGGPETRPDFMRGMVVSCPRFGQIWGSPAMTSSLEELAELGVEWISIHPYASVRRNGSVRHWPAAETGYLGRAGEIVQAAGMKLFWKPHLAYWGSFEWRGAIDFGDDQGAWDDFFTGYETFIVDQATFAQRLGVELFAVGVELEGTTHFADRWAHIIQRVRSVYDGALTYAANWDSVDSIPFWSSLDVIGVHAYFPLSDGSDPSRQELWDAWSAPLERLASLAERSGGKPVVFAEIGYNRSPDAARVPWDFEVDDSRHARVLRKRLIEVALERAKAAPGVQGMFWWKWIPGDWRHDRDFSMRNPEAREALFESWGRTPRAATVDTPAGSSPRR